MHLIKVPAEDGRYKYSLPQETRTIPLHKFKRALLDHFLSVDYADNLVVMKCLPGTANTLGALLDGWIGLKSWVQLVVMIPFSFICRSKEMSSKVVETLHNLMS